MIYISGASSSVAVTLREKTQSLNPYYVWQLESKSRKTSTYYYADNYSTSPYFDIFTFSNTPGSATAGHIGLPGGEYIYRVYESSIPYSITASTGNLTETGICIIANTYSNINIYTQSTDQVIHTYRDF